MMTLAEDHCQLSSHTNPTVVHFKSCNLFCEVKYENQGYDIY